MEVPKEGVTEACHYTSSLCIRTLEVFLSSKKFTINEQPEVIEESECIGTPKVTDIHIQNVPFEFLERLKQAGLVTRCNDDSYTITIDDDIKLCFQGMKEG